MANKQPTWGANTRLSVPDHVLSRRAAGETVLLDLNSEEYFGLDGVGSRFFELLEAGRSYGEIVETLIDEYEVERAVLEADLSALITELAASGLLVVDGS